MSDPPSTAVRIPFWLWARLVGDLRRRGAGRRESGAFLLGRRRGDGARVGSYLCYDDLDPVAYVGGAIAFHAVGYAALWRHCKAKAVEVIADVHTHGSADVRQSPIDERHPMVPVVGHTAIIVPHFACTARWRLGAVGVYEYLGNYQWRRHAPDGRPRRLGFCFW